MRNNSALDKQNPFCGRTLQSVLQRNYFLMTATLVISVTSPVPCD